MSDKRQDVMGSLPSTRPHRRSTRRAAAGRDAPDEMPVRTAPEKPAAASATGSKRTPRAPREGTAAGTTAAKRSTTGAGGAAGTAASRESRAVRAKKPPANVRRQRPAGSPAPRAADARPARPRDAVAEPSPTPDRPGAIETLVQAAAELTEIGLRASARAVRGAVSRLPHP